MGNPPEAIDARLELMMILHGYSKSMALKAICKLGIPDMLNRAGGDKFMSVDEIAKELPSDHVNTTFLTKILNATATFGLLAAKKDDTAPKRYGLNALSSLLVTENNPGSMAPAVIYKMHEVGQAPWHRFADAVLTGGYPFSIAHGKNMWEKTKDDPDWNIVMKGAMTSISMLTIDAIVGKYEGFKNIKTLVDVGGGSGMVMREIVKKHPQIHGIVFDLAHTIAENPPMEGVEYVGGDMFESVPSGDAVFMKYILHDWDDERCIQILKNCMKAVPEDGKVILAENIVPEEENSPYKVFTAYLDLAMLAGCDGGMERTKKQWMKLLDDAGFARIQFVQLSSGKGLSVNWLIECYKN